MPRASSRNGTPVPMDIDAKSDGSSVPSEKAQTTYAVGQPVEAKHMAQQVGSFAAKWYSGVVRKVHENGACDVIFDDGDTEDKVPLKFLRLPRKAKAAAPVKEQQPAAASSAASDDDDEPREPQYYGKRSPHQTAQTSAPKRRRPESRGACVSLSSVVQALCFAFGRKGEEQEEEEAETQGLVDLVNTRIRVWWTGEKAWYAGRVTSVGRGASGSLHTIAYDDGAQATHYLQSAESALNETWEPEEPLPECKTPAKLPPGAWTFFEREAPSSMPQLFGASRVVSLRLLPAAAARSTVMLPTASES